MNAPFPRAASALALAAMVFATACRSRRDAFQVPGNAADWNATKIAARQDLGEIPPPSKAAYTAIDQEEQWQNPFLSVASNMIQLRIYLADENSSSLDRGGLTRLKAARKQVLDVRLKDLPRALTSLPASAWPYGRVVAVGEALEPPRSQPRLSANIVVTAATLRDMGVVADLWSGRGAAR